MKGLRDLYPMVDEDMQWVWKKWESRVIFLG